MNVGEGNISGMGTPRAQARGAKMRCVLGAPLVILCTWDLEGRLEGAAAEAGCMGN